MKKLAFLLILLLQACSNNSVTSPDSIESGGASAPNSSKIPVHSAPTAPGYIVRLGEPTGVVSEKALTTQTRAVSNFSALLNRTDAKPVNVYRTLLGRAFNGVAVDITPEEARKLQAAGFVVQKDYVMVAANDFNGRNDLIARMVVPKPGDGGDGGGGGGGPAPTKTPTPTPTPTATAAPLTGLGSRIAIIDSGVDYHHAEFGSCTSFATCAKFVDYKTFITGGGNACDLDPIDCFGHGTHVASIAAGLTSGVAPGAKIAAYKVLDSTGYSTASIIMAAVNYAIGKVDIINLSLRVVDNDADAPLLNEAIQNAIASGILPVIAAGNNGRVGTSPYKTILTPGVMTDALTVGAGSGMNVADFSSKGPANVPGFPLKPEVVAPGVGICGAALVGQQMYPNFTPPACDDTHYKLSGTSMAAPYVAGIVALLKQKFAALTPALTPAQLKSIVTLSAQRNGQTYSSVGHGVNPDGGWSSAYSTEVCTLITAPSSLSDLTATLDVPTTFVHGGTQYSPANSFQPRAVLRPDDGSGKPDGNTMLATATFMQTSLMNQVTSSGTGQQVWYSFEAAPFFTDAAHTRLLTGFPATAQWLCGLWPDPPPDPALGMDTATYPREFLFTVPDPWLTPTYSDYVRDATYYDGWGDPPFSLPGYSATSPAMRLQLRTTRTGTSYDYGAGRADVGAAIDLPITANIPIQNFGVVDAPGRYPATGSFAVGLKNLTATSQYITISVPPARQNLDLLKRLPSTIATPSPLILDGGAPNFTIAANGTASILFHLDIPSGQADGYYEGEITLGVGTKTLNVPYSFIVIADDLWLFDAWDHPDGIPKATHIPNFSDLSNYEADWNDVEWMTGMGTNHALDLALKTGRRNGDSYLFVGVKVHKSAALIDALDNLYLYFDVGNNGAWGAGSYDRILMANQDDRKRLDVRNNLQPNPQIFNGYRWTDTDSEYSPRAILFDQSADNNGGVWLAEFQVRLRPKDTSPPTPPTHGDLDVGPNDVIRFNISNDDSSTSPSVTLAGEFDPLDAMTYLPQFMLPSAIDEVPDANWDSKLLHEELLSTLLGGQHYSASVWMQNKGSTTWTLATGEHLVSRNTPATLWGPTLNYDLSSTDSISPVATPPALSYKQFQLNDITAPSTPGNYEFNWTMVKGTPTPVSFGQSTTSNGQVITVLDPSTPSAACGAPCSSNPASNSVNHILAGTCDTPHRKNVICHNPSDPSDCNSPANPDETNSVYDIVLRAPTLGGTPTNPTLGKNLPLTVSIHYACYQNRLEPSVLPSTDTLALWYFNGSAWKLIKGWQAPLFNCDDVEDGVDDILTYTFTPDAPGVVPGAMGTQYVRAIEASDTPTADSSKCPDLLWGNIDDMQFTVVP